MGRGEQDRRRSDRVRRRPDVGQPAGGRSWRLALPCRQRALCVPKRDPDRAEQIHALRSRAWALRDDRSRARRRRVLRVCRVRLSDHASDPDRLDRANGLAQISVVQHFRIRRAAARRMHRLSGLDLGVRDPAPDRDPTFDRSRGRPWLNRNAGNGCGRLWPDRAGGQRVGQPRPDLDHLSDHAANPGRASKRDARPRHANRRGFSRQTTSGAIAPQSSTARTSTQERRFKDPGCPNSFNFAAAPRLQLASFLPQQGEVVVDTDHNRAVVGDGSTTGGYPAAKLAETVTNTRVSVGDAITASAFGDRPDDRPTRRSPPRASSPSWRRAPIRPERGCSLSMKAAPARRRTRSR